MNEDDAGRQALCVDDVLITDHLDGRPSREPDYAAENRALATLAQEMAQHSEGVLQRVAELAMELCRADSAGISVLEPGGERGIFRWHAASGAFASSLNGTIPHEASPCGTVIERNQLLLLEGGERFFPAMEGFKPRIYESLLTPWTVNGEPAGTLWLIKHTPDGHFDAEDARLLRSLSRFASAAYQMVAALQSAQNSQQELELKVEERTRELRHSEQQYRTLFTTMEQGFCIIEKLPTAADEPSDFRYLVANPAFESHTGLRDAVGKTIRQLVSEAETSIMDRYDRVVRTRKPDRFEGYVVQLNLWMEAEVFPTSVPGQIAVLFSNVSERKRAEEALRESEARQAFLLRLSDTLRPIGDAGEAQTEAMRVLGQTLGISRAQYFEVDPTGQFVEPHGGYAENALPPAGRIRLDDFGRQPREAYQAGQTFVVTDTADLPISADERRTYEAAGTRSAVGAPIIKAGELVAVLGVSNDKPRFWSAQDVAIIEETAERVWAAAERARAEAALRESEQRLQAVLETDAVAVLFFSREGVLTKANDVFLRMTGYSRQDVETGRLTWQQMTAPEWLAVSQEQMDQFLINGRVGPYEKEYLRKDGTRAWMLFAGRDLGDGTIVKLGVDIADRKLAEETLSETVDRLRLVVESARDYAIFTTDAEGTVVEWYPGAETVFGYAASEIRGRSAEILFTTEDRVAGEFRKELEQARRVGSAADVRWHVHQFGHHVFLDGHTTALRDANGRLTGFLKIGQDVTERRQAEEALRESREQLARELEDAKQLQRISSLLVEEGHGEGLYEVILDASIAVLRADFGSLQLLDGGKLHLLAWRNFHPESAAFWKEVSVTTGSTCGRALRHGERMIVADVQNSKIVGPEDVKHYLKSGILSVQSTPLVTRYGKVIGMISTHWREVHTPDERELRLLDVVARQATDFFERRRAQEALRDSEERFRLLVENVQEYALFQTDPPGKVTSWNPGAERLFGFTSAEMLGQSVDRLLTPEDQQAGLFAQEIARVLAGEHVEDVRWLVRKDGSRFWAQWVTEPVHDEAGQLRGVAKVLRNETDRKQAEERQRLLMGELNHRVKNTLAAVQSIANQTLRSSASPETFASQFQGRIQALAQAHNLLTRVSWESADIADILREQLALDGDKHRVSLNGPPALLPASSSLALALVLHELGTNTRKYGALSVSEGKVSITWSVENSEDGPALHLVWVEHEGPLVGPPEKQGFGTTLIKHSLAGIGGETNLQFLAQGLCCDIRMPLASDANEN